MTEEPNVLDDRPNRTPCITRKVSTPFGSMYIQIDLDTNGLPVGGAISDPGKEPDSTIAQLVQSLSEGLDDAMSVMKLTEKKHAQNASETT